MKKIASIGQNIEIMTRRSSIATTSDRGGAQPQWRLSANILLASTAAFILAACAVGPDFKTPAAPEVKTFTQGELPEKTAAAANKAGAAQTFAHNKQLQADWWKLFNSPDLDALMEQALKHNPDLQAAKAALTQAQENMLSGRGALFPSVDVNLGASRQRNSSAGSGQSFPGRVFNLYNSSVDVSYAVDIFGATRRGIEGLEALEDYQRYELEAAYLTLTANVATAAIQEASLREQVKETKDIITLQREQLNLFNKQFELGAIAKTALLEQQALVAQTETTLPPLEKQLAQQRNLLAALAGKFPGDGVDQTFNLTSLHLPEELPVSLPSDLVSQRPDIKAAEALMKQANAQVGLATAAMLPRITIAGGYGGTSQNINNVVTPETLVWNLGANLFQPIFHGGELLHDKRSKVAGYEIAEAQYRSTVLGAFRNVADVLRALQYDADALASQVKSEQAAGDSFKLSRTQYEAGAITYSQMLDTQRAWQQARIGLVQAQAARFADTVALYQALGGGWWNRDKPAEAAPVAAPAAEVATPAPVAPAAETAPVAAPAPVAKSPLELVAPAAPVAQAAPEETHKTEPKAPFILLPPATAPQP